MKQKNSYEYLIVGAGPAGLQLGYFLENAGRNYLILEKGATVGTFFKKFPRHRKLLSINKVYTGFSDLEIQLRWDWNSLLSDNELMRLPAYTEEYFPDADDIVDYLKDYAQHFELNIKYGTTVQAISKEELFHIQDTNGNVYFAKNLIMATGVSGPFIPPINGIEFTENYVDVSVDPKDFKNQQVLIIGKGNSAFETAEALVETAASIHLCSPNPVRMAWQTHFVGDLRAINNNILDTYQLKSQNAVLDAIIENIEKRSSKYVVSVAYQHADGEKEDLVYDRIITCTGFCFDTSIFAPSLRPEMALNGRIPKQTCEWESTNIQNLYFIGTLMQARDYKKTTSAFIHGFRYNIRALYHILACKNHGQQWPHRVIPFNIETIVEAVLERINRSSGMWQQFGYLCDLLIVSPDKKTVDYYEDIPVDYLFNSPLGEQTHCYTITLEYGPHHVFSDPFNVTRISRDDVENAHMSHFLHPIVRYFNKTQLVQEHHVIEDLAAKWEEDIHIDPLIDFFTQTECI